MLLFSPLRRRLRALEARLAAIEPARLDVLLAAGDRAIAAAGATEPDEVDRRCAQLADAEALARAGLAAEWRRSDDSSSARYSTEGCKPQLRLRAWTADHGRPFYAAELYLEDSTFEVRKLSGYLPVGSSIRQAEAAAEHAGALLLELHERRR